MAVPEYRNPDGITSTDVSAATPLPVTGGGTATADSTGLPLPANFASLAQVLTYNGDGTLATVASTTGGSTYTQTLTYTSGNLTGVSAWVKS